MSTRLTRFALRGRERSPLPLNNGIGGSMPGGELSVVVPRVLREAQDGPRLNATVFVYGSGTPSHLARAPADCIFLLTNNRWTSAQTMLLVLHTVWVAMARPFQSPAKETQHLLHGQPSANAHVSPQSPATISYPRALTEKQVQIASSSGSDPP